MGEAKRRKKLDPNYGRSIPNILRDIAGGLELLYGQQIDLEEFNRRFGTLLDRPDVNKVLGELAQKSIYRNMMSLEDFNSPESIQAFIQKLRSAEEWIQS